MKEDEKRHDDTVKGLSELSWREMLLAYMRGNSTDEDKVEEGLVSFI